MISKYKIYNDQIVYDYLLSRHLSKTNIYKLLLNKAITVNNKVLKKNDELIKGDILQINYSLFETNEKILANNNCDNYYDIIFENSEIICVDKKKPCLVHSDGNTLDTILNSLIGYLKKQKDDSYLRPIHRIDCETLGLCLFAKNILSYNEVMKQFEDEAIEKKYLTIVRGIVNKDEEVTLLLGKNRHKNNTYMVTNSGKIAKTYYKPLKTYNNKTLLEVKIKTGRTHQIRVTMAYLKHNIVGDKIYGKDEKESLKLISHSLNFNLNSKQIILKSKQEFKDI